MDQRDITKPDTAQGLYERYRVERIDGRTDEGGGYFVLRTHNLTNDKPEVAALRAYVVAVRGTHPALASDIERMLPEPPPSNGSVHDALLELADNIELNLDMDRSVEPEAARQNMDLFRRAAAIVKVHETGERLKPEVVESRFVEVHYAIGAHNEGRTVLRFEGLPDVSLLDADATALVREHMRKSMFVSAQPQDPDHGQPSPEFISEDPSGGPAERLEAASKNPSTEEQGPECRGEVARPRRFRAPARPAVEPAQRGSAELHAPYRTAPTRQQILAKHYVQHGWTLHLTEQRVHLMDKYGTIACDPGAMIKGVRIEAEQLGEALGRALCGRCCSTTNDHVSTD